MPKNIVDGKVEALSPSMISTFDATTTFGCERRGYFKYVLGYEEPPSPNQQLGTDLHALIEKRLTEKATPEASGEAAGLYLAGQAMIERVASLDIQGIEAPLKPFFIDGIPVKGFVDVVHSRGIVDWKTSSDIRRYGKTPEQLATDTQMVIYGRAMHPNLSSVLLAHGQFQTRGAKRTDFVEVEVTRNHLDAHINNVIVPVVARIREVATAEKFQDVPGDTTKCGRCPFNQKCKGEVIMSFFKNMKSSPTPPSPAPILPPDAPESKPELAAKPVEGYSPPAPVSIPTPTPIPADAPRRRGRPPGSKNKPKMLIVDADDAPTSPPAPVSPPIGATRPSPGIVSSVSAPSPAPTPAPTPAPVSSKATRFKAVTVTKGATINLGNYNSARFEISVTVEGEDYEASYYEALTKVDAALESEAGKFESMAKPEAK